ncbi:PAS domain S-box protein [Tichowtungia aerotolerans]|uniref:histidine kinase n=1 Tax=Tichowtungia aerotolerans TaxID=2697043 RepID=A0A6P1MCC1_9BACT|nr:PAS domain S-box protein [Tichowtungia aerotolerans]QHI69246.1 PAS domain S-box protein [Tichowtungia aerotolerans]
MFFEILRNIAILLAFCMIYSLLFQSRNRSTFSGRCWLGVIFGLAGVLAMLTPTALFPGVLIDGRSIFVSISGLFGGWVSALIAAGVSIVCRIILGGPGAIVGCGIILSSALIGTGYHYLCRRDLSKISNFQFWLFGLFVHLIMICILPALPSNIRWEVIHLISFPVLLIYPAGTVLVCRLLLVQDEQASSKRMLAENQERLSSILRVVPTGIGLVKDRVITDLNPQVCEITGYGYDELIGKNSRMLYLSEKEYLRVGYEKHRQIAEHGTCMLESQWKRKDGTVCDVLLSATPLSPKSLVAGITFTALDITDRKRAEDALRQSIHELKMHVEQSPLAIVRWDLNFLAVEWNRAAERIFGFSRREAIGQHGTFIIPENARTQVDVVWNQLLLNSGGTRNTNENITKDGRVILCEWYNVPLLDDTGKVFGVASQVMDVTERRKIEEEWDQLMLAIEQSAEMVVITDADANIQYVNRAFEKVTGYRRDEVIGKNPRLLQSGKQSALFYRKMWKILSSGDPWSGQLVNRKKNGTIYTEDATISAVCAEDGTVINYVAVKRDVTHELDLEDQLRQAQKMEAVGQMAGGIAHDFNNLLQVIGGYAELSLMGVDETNPCWTALNEIQDASTRGKSLVSQLLAFSRRQVIHPVDLNLNVVIERLLQMIRGLIGEHISLDFIAGHNLGTIHADHGLIEQVLMNLCVNARDAMPDGGKIIVETENVLIDGDYANTHAWASPGRYVLLSVTDNGSGMDSRTVEHIFEPFFTTKEVGKGTGLGLSTVFGIVKQHEGHVTVYSELEKGTVFKIYLPIVGRKATEISREVPGPVFGGTETILIAEDDETVLKLAEHLLMDAGYTVLTACDGEEAIRVFEEHADEIDAVMFDVVMPRLGGKQALERILELRPGLPHLFASGYSENAVHTNFIQKRGLHLLSKPYQTETLLRKIREVLDEEKS